jgi:hypothetical protein
LPRKRPVLLSIVLVLVSFLVLSAKKIFDYAANPDKEKESDFVFPHNPDQEKPTVLIAEPKSLPMAFRQRGGFTNDASHLNKTAVYGIVEVANEDDIRSSAVRARQ